MKRFFAELKRRNVYKGAVAYASAPPASCVVNRVLWRWGKDCRREIAREFTSLEAVFNR